MKRNILLNPGPATTTDAVKMAQVVPDICPREKEFGEVMRSVASDILKVVHADPSKFSAVLFCGSGTLNIDVCVNSLVPRNKKILIINNGSYSSRAADIARAYSLDLIELSLPIDEPIDTRKVEQVMGEHEDIAVVYTTHQETGTGILNPIREIGDVAHRRGAIFACDTTSTLAMLPLDMERDNLDFSFASAQKGLQAMTGLSFIIGRTSIIEASADYPRRSYYCNLFLQYDYFKKFGEMQFTPPVQTIYAAREGLREYFAEGEQAKWQRHAKTMEAIHDGFAALGFREAIRRENQSGLVAAVRYPDDANWDFDAVHDYCYERGFTIYPGKMQSKHTFRLCSLGAIDERDIKEFFTVFRESLIAINVKIPVTYNE
ncbi:MAG: 2-aminoethylphosphonate aminotransferase [Schwartzia sp.]|nr:2-aminoethylphosphonate aminotransferase [Schwartzia sp. (in: firmicutes)]